MLKILLVLQLAMSVVAALAPTPLVPEVVWNLASHATYQIRVDRLFSNVENVMVTCDPPETTWYDVIRHSQLSSSCPF